MVNDNVNSPSHYTQSAIECIEAIKSATGEGFSDYCQGNIIKYIVRCGRKTEDPRQDLKKALWYIQKELAQYE